MIAPSLFTFANLHRQYVACRRNRRNSANALRFEARQEEKLLALREALVSRTYAPTRSVCFFPPGPKLREVFAADFSDRIVHHVLVERLERIFEPRFIHDSYACRRGRGVHAAVRRLQQFIRQATANGTRRGWYLQLDIRNYFMSIDRDILHSQIAGRVDDDEVLWLARVLIYHDCTADYVYRGPPGAYARVPAHKTLFGVPKSKGLPIGNLNSQFFANLYLDGFDHFVKHTLNCRHYIRYCDDFVLLASDRAVLLDWHAQMATYLREELGLELNAKRTRLRPLGDGVDFLGYIVRRDYLLVRRRVVNKLKEKLKAFEAELVDEGSGWRRYGFDEERLDALHATLSSYLGHCKMASTHHLWKSLWARNAWLREYFDFDADARKLVRTYKAPRGFRRAAQQYRYYRWRFRQDVVLFQVGRFFEFYARANADVARWLGLRPMAGNARGAHYGFPVGALGRNIETLLAAGRSVVVIAESDAYLTRIKHRVAAYRIEPATKTRELSSPNAPGARPALTPAIDYGSTSALT